MDRAESKGAAILRAWGRHMAQRPARPYFIAPSPDEWARLPAGTGETRKYSPSTSRRAPYDTPCPECLEVLAAELAIQQAVQDAAEDLDVGDTELLSAGTSTLRNLCLHVFRDSIDIAEFPCPTLDRLAAATGIGRAGRTAMLRRMLTAVQATAEKMNAESK